MEVTYPPLFWQYLTAAELAPRKSWAILQQLKESSLDPVSFLLSHPLLNESESLRIRRADVTGLERMLEQGIHLLTPEKYPPELQRVEYPPPCLFAWGQSEVLNFRKIGIVGTRAATSYGKSVAFRFAKQLAAEKVVVISGGAYGIDAVAHQGAIDANGTTVVVMPTGIETSYPVQHGPLYIKAREKGCLLSPFAVGSKWQLTRPLIRNNLIAALCEAIIVIEAPEKSGALATASAAAEYGREVFVVPANIDNKNFKGSHRLLREGATLVDSPDQILEFLGIEPSYRNTSVEKDPVCHKILKILEQGPSSVEKIISLLSLNSTEVLTGLTTLEVEGKVHRDAGEYALR